METAEPCQFQTTKRVNRLFRDSARTLSRRAIKTVRIWIQSRALLPIIDDQTRNHLYKSQLPVVEQALETVALMLGSDKARGYCLEMICADFLAGSGTQENQLEVLVLSLERLYQTLPDDGRQQLVARIREGPWKSCAKNGHVSL
jgi:hypothetical protein